MRDQGHMRGYRTGYAPTMYTLLWIISAILVIAGILSNWWLRPLISVGYAILGTILSPLNAIFS